MVSCEQQEARKGEEIEKRNGLEKERNGVVVGWAAALVEREISKLYIRVK